MRTPRWRLQGAALPTARALSPLPGHTNSEARGINIFGVVVGSSRGVDHVSAVMWTPEGQPRELTPLDGQHGAEAYAINIFGEVAGISHSAGQTAVLWDWRGKPTPLLPLPGDVESVARAINAQGQVAGYSIRRSGSDAPIGGLGLTPVVWDRQGTARALSLPKGATEAAALGINARGEVVGFSFTPDYVDAIALWTANGAPRSLSLLPQDTRSEGHAINLFGRLAGDSGDGGEDIAAVWSPRPQRRVPLGGDAGSEALAINVKGETPGWSVGPDGSTGLVWSASGRATPLPPLPGDTESQAYAINDGGKVAGTSVGAERYTAVVWNARACLGFFGLGNLTTE